MPVAHRSFTPFETHEQRFFVVPRAAEEGDLDLAEQDIEGKVRRILLPPLEPDQILGNGALVPRFAAMADVVVVDPLALMPEVLRLVEGATEPEHLRGAAGAVFRSQNS